MRDVEVYIKRKGVKEYRLSEQFSRNFHVLKAYMSSPQIKPSYATNTGSDGSTLTNVAFDATVFTLECFIDGINKDDYRLIRDAFYREFYAREVIEMRTSLEPAKAVYVVPKPIEMLPDDGYSSVAFNFQLDVLQGYRHTPFTSTQLSMYQEMVQFGMNFDIDNLPSYHFKSNRFKVYNASDLAIDPYIHRHNLTWHIKGKGRDILIRNNTNGTSFKVLGEVIDFTMNGVNGSQRTDFGHIVLEKGDNDIQVTGLNDPDISVDFPFLYF